MMIWILAISTLFALLIVTLIYTLMFPEGEEDEFVLDDH